MSIQRFSVETSQHVTVYYGTLLGIGVESDGTAATYVKVYSGDSAVASKLIALVAMPSGGVAQERKIKEIGFNQLYVGVSGPVTRVYLIVDVHMRVGGFGAQGYGADGYGEGGYGY